MVACVHGTEPCSKCERTTVENSQVRMMSWACGRWSMGKTCANSSGSVSQPEATCGDSDDVRSEEHTSELQSRQYLVCRLLLEKKKKYHNNKNVSTATICL